MSQTPVYVQPINVVPYKDITKQTHRVVGFLIMLFSLASGLLIGFLIAPWLFTLGCE